MLWTHIKGLNVAETRSDSPQLAYSYGLHPAPAAAVGLGERGLRFSLRALEMAEESGDLLTAGHTHTMRAMACFTVGNYEDAVKHGEESVVLLERAGDQYLRYLGGVHAALGHWQLGNTQKAVELLSETFSRSVKLGDAGLPGTLYMASVVSGGFSSL